MTDAPFATGGCVCGKVTYAINAEPLRMAKCHCKDCQRSSGAGHLALAFFKADDVVISGETATHAVPAKSGNVNSRQFCPTCGSRLFGTNSAREGIIAVTVGSVDDNSWFKPAAVVYDSQRPTYEPAAEGIPAFPEMPPPQG